MAIAVIAVGDLSFASQATLRFGPSVPPGQAAAIVADMHRFLGERMDTPAAREPAWRVAWRGSELRLTVAGATPGDSRRMASELANDFVARVDAEAQRALDTPANVEMMLSNDLSARREQASAGRDRLARDAGSLPQVSPRSEQEKALAQWRDLRFDYEQARAELDQAASRLESLQERGMPQTATATPAERLAAQEQDAALLQDRRELAVNLAELRDEVAKVSRRVEAPLERTVAVVQALRFDIGQAGNEPADPETAPALLSASDSLERYRGELDLFLSGWRNGIDSITASQTPDPELIHHHERLEKLSRDFVRHSGGHLAELEGSCGRLTANRPTAPHAAAADVTRGLPEVQAAHRALTFQLAMIEAKENFRIDAALRSAQGLNARCQARVQEIEDRLNAAALEVAQGRYTTNVAAAETELVTVRKRHDKVVAELLRAHESLVAIMGKTQGFIEQSASVQLTARLMEAGNEEIQRLERQLEELVEERRGARVKEPLEVVSVVADQLPIAFRERCRTAAIAGAVTIMAMLIGQFWRGRRLETKD